MRQNKNVMNPFWYDCKYWMSQNILSKEYPSYKISILKYVLSKKVSVESKPDYPTVPVFNILSDSAFIELIRHPVDLTLTEDKQV